MNQELSLCAFKGVLGALEAYAKRNNIAFPDALCHALTVLGTADAAITAKGTLAYAPDYDGQMALMYWTNQLPSAVPVSLEICDGIRDQLVDVPPTRVIEKSADAFRAYMAANNVTDYNALSRAVYVLMMMERKQLVVIKPDGEQERLSFTLPGR